MYHNSVKALAAGLVAASVSLAGISGKVTDTSGGAVASAVVKLEKGGDSVVTGADGSFTLKPAAVLGGSDEHWARRSTVKMEGGFLRLTVAKRSDVEIVSFDLGGKSIATVRRRLDRGEHSFPLPSKGTGISVNKINVGGSSFLFRTVGIGGTARRAGTAERDACPRRSSAKRSRAVPDMSDVIAVTKDGYLNYREIVTNPDTSGIEIRLIVCAATVTDVDGNVYQAVKLGSQIWTVENLRTTKYNDGTPIPLVTAVSAWSVLTSPAYCFYNNTTDADSSRKFGALYTWYAVNTTKLAPAGWHVPSDVEWEALQTFLTANGYNWDGTTSSTPWNKIAKSIATRTDWQSSTKSGAIGNDPRKNNRSGFSAFPGGARLISGYFFFNGEKGSWWTTAEYDPPYAWFRYLSYDDERLDRGYSMESSGYSVRVVKD